MDSSEDFMSKISTMSADIEVMKRDTLNLVNKLIDGKIFFVVPLSSFGFKRGNKRKCKPQYVHYFDGVVWVEMNWQNLKTGEYTMNDFASVKFSENLLDSEIK